MRAAPPGAGRRRLLRRAAVGLVAPAIAPRAQKVPAPFVFRCAHNIPAAHPTHLRLSEAAGLLYRESAGRVVIEVYPESQLGSETDLLRQLRSGAIDFLPLSGLTLQTLVPVAGVNGLAFVFDSLAKVWSAMDGAVGAAVRSAIAATDLHAFERMFDNGFRHLTTASRPIRSVRDLKGLKIRVPLSPLRTSMFTALGALPVSIHFAELYMALQNHLVEAEENPLLIIEVARLHEVQRYCSLTRHMWDGHWLLAHAPRWRSLPPDIRLLIERHLLAAIQRQREDFQRLETGLEQRLRATGLVFNAPPREPFRQALIDAGFYVEWRRRFGPAVMQPLERCCGPIG